MRKSILIFLSIASVANAQTINKYPDERSEATASTQSGFAPQVFLAGTTSEELRIPYLETEQSTRTLTGVLSQDLLSAQTDTLSHKDSLALLETRSSLKSGVFSLLIPGTGQIYNGGTGNYIKAAGFLAIEAAAIAVNIIWTNKGNNQTTFFQNYADANFSVLRYAEWIKLNFSVWDPSADDGTINLVNEMFVDNGPAPWQKVDFERLNEVESILGQTSAGQFFAHNLAEHGTQDYYEIIGKYPQFREGWNPNAATDNVNVTYDQLKYDLEVAQDNYYMDQRGKANNLYSVAGTALGVVIANHFLSAIEAAIWAHGHNKLIETSVGVSPLPQGLGYQTQLNLTVNF
jgi:hypothetical protein